MPCLKPNTTRLCPLEMPTLTPRKLTQRASAPKTGPAAGSIAGPSSESRLRPNLCVPWWKDLSTAADVEGKTTENKNLATRPPKPERAGVRRPARARESKRRREGGKEESREFITSEQSTFITAEQSTFERLA